MKKILSFCLVLCMFTCLFVGCGKGDSNKEVIKFDDSSDLSTSDDTSSTTVSSVESDANETKDIEYSLDHLSKAVKVWQNFSNYGIGCELAFAYGDNSAWQHLSVDQQAWASDVQSSVCCNSKTEAESHIEKYVSVGLYKALDDGILLEYDGGLYCVIGAKGFIEFDTELKVSDVVRTAYDKLSVTTEMYASGGDLYCLEKFDFEYIDGAYKITAVTDIELDDAVTSSEQSTVTSTDFSKFCGEYLEGDADMGPCYSFVLESVDPKTQKATFSVNYIGRNVSPIYTTDSVTATVDDNGKATFSWEDNWENKGVGEFTLCDGDKLCVKIKMTVTKLAESNRATLGTEGVRTLYLYK